MAYGIIWVTVTFGTAKAAQKAPILVLLSRHRTRADRDGHPRPFRGAFHQKEHGLLGASHVTRHLLKHRLGLPETPHGQEDLERAEKAEQRSRSFNGSVVVIPLCNFQADLSSPPSS